MSALQCPPVRRADTQVGPYVGPTSRPADQNRQRRKSVSEDRTMTRSIVKFILIAICNFFATTAPASAADKVTMSSTNPTAFEIDQIVARATRVSSPGKIDVRVDLHDAGPGDQSAACRHRRHGQIGHPLRLRSRRRGGGELKVIGGSTYGYAYQVIGQPQFKTLADLKGQKIAGAVVASITTTIFKDVMQRQGVPPSAYTILSIGGSAERFQAVASGQVAASLAEAPPYNFRSIDAGKRRTAQLLGRDQELAVHRLPTSPRTNRWRKTRPAAGALHARDRAGECAG